MRKLSILALGSIISLFISCKNLAVPSTVTLHMDSQYNFAMGNFTKDFSENLSFNTISGQVNASSNGFSFYDYNPNNSAPCQEYIINYSVCNMDVWDLIVNKLTTVNGFDLKDMAETNPDGLKDVLAYIGPQTITVDNSSAIQFNIDTGLNKTKLFGNMGSVLQDSNGSTFISKLNINHLYAYLYITKPSSYLEGLDFTGTITASNTIKSFNIFERNSSGTGSSLVSYVPPLIPNSSKVVTSEEKASKATSVTDLKDLINHETNTLTISTTDLTMSSFTVTLDSDLVENRNKLGKIQMVLRLVFPLDFTSSEDLALNLIGSNSISGFKASNDLLGRSEATDTSNINKFMDICDAFNLRVNADNELLKYTDNHNLKVKITEDSSCHILGDDNREFEIDFENGSKSLTMTQIKQIFEAYPYKADVSLVIPEGSFVIPRNPSLKVYFSVGISLDGDYSLK